MKKVLIVDLWNGEGYSDSKAWFKQFENETKAREYIMEGVMSASGGIDMVMDAVEGYKEESHLSPGLVVENDRIIYDMGEDQGSYHYKVIEEGEHVFGVVLHPNINEYTLITDAEEWLGITDKFKAIAKEDKWNEEDAYLGRCFDSGDVWNDGWDVILFDTEMLYEEEDKVYMLHHTSDLQESNEHILYPNKEELDKAFKRLTDVVITDEIYSEDEDALYFTTMDGTERIYKEIYYKF